MIKTNQNKSDVLITKEDIENAIKSVNFDSSAGFDGVIPRALKQTDCSKTIATLANVIIKFSVIPKCFCQGRTILIHKDGDSSDPKNYRPITIYPLVRRVIEKCLEKKLSFYTSTAPEQRGFKMGPGTHINASLINGCLKDAKSKKKDLCIAFLDVSKAFDSIGHIHIEKTLQSSGTPSSLVKCIMAFVKNNTTIVENKMEKTNPIEIKRGVAQGAPTSPLLFSLAIDHIVREQNENSIKEAYGYEITTSEQLSLLAFADDLAIVARNKEAASALINMVDIKLKEIGLDMNPVKSQAIFLSKGKLTKENIFSYRGIIKTIDNHETVRYLGTNFSDEIQLDPVTLMSQLTSKLQNLAESPLLQPSQKLNVINQYIWPILIYPLQCAPLDKIPSRFLKDVDIQTRNAVKEILSIPMDTPNGMIYGPKKYRGLGIMKAEWEASLQNINILKKLSDSNNPLLKLLRNCENEIVVACNGLQVENSLTVKMMREVLRVRAFDEWANMSLRGIGVAVYKETTKCNKWVYDKQTLSSSEWTAALKMSANIAGVRVIPGRTTGTTLCRHSGCTEIETLPHVLGSCRKSELLRNTRHHTVRSTIASEMRHLGWNVDEEISCLSDDSSTRRCDIIAVKSDSSQVLILDPTVRFEKNASQADEVDREKKSIYEPCIGDLARRYQIEANKFKVIGLLFGARGAIPSFTFSVLRDLGIPNKKIIDMSLKILKDSVHILNYHLFH